MSMTVDIAVLHAIACSQIVILYFLSAPVYFRLIRHSFLRKNPEWLAANPAFAQSAMPARRAAWLARAFGAAWLLFFAARYLAGFERDAPWSLLYAPMIGWVALESAYAALAYRTVYKKIPLPAKRRAALAPRALTDLFDPRWLYPAYFSIALVIGLYLAAWLRGDLDLPLLAVRMGGLALCVAAWAWTLNYYLRRKKRPLDEQLGASYRRLEIIETAVCLYAIAAIYGYKVAQDAFGLPLLSETGLFMAASVLVQALVLIGPRHSSLKALFDPAPQ